MTSKLDRSYREAVNKRKAANAERRKEKEEKTQTARFVKQRQAEKREYRKKSAARYDRRSMVRTMIYSVGILFIAFLVFECLLLVYKSLHGAGYSNNDTYWHLINIADTCIGFVIGLTAMDALTYYEQGRKSKRDEQRAIIRHNRIIKPCIDMYLARKNGLITPAGEETKHFQVVTKSCIRDMKDLYGNSEITSDAGKVKIDSFEFYLKKLNVAFLNMAEDINFDYNPEICDAVMDFLNETTYGMAALESLVSYGKDGNRTQKMNMIRQIKEAPDDVTLSEINTGELNVAFIVMRMIHTQEDALERYMNAVGEIDAESDRRSKKLH